MFNLLRYCLSDILKWVALLALGILLIAGAVTKDSNFFIFGLLAGGVVLGMSLEQDLIEHDMKNMLNDGMKPPDDEDEDQ